MSDYTYDAPPVRLVRAGDLDAANARISELTTALERNLAAMETANATADSLFQRVALAERERYNHKLRALELDMLVDGLEKRVAILTEKLLSEMKRAEEAEAKLALVDEYAAATARAWNQGMATMAFEEWLGVQPEVQP